MNPCPKRVGTDRLVDASSAGEAAHDPPGGVAVEPFAVAAEEDRPLESLAECLGHP